MAKPVIIPFVVNRNLSFVIEIGFKKIRFYAEHGKIIKDDEVYSIDSPYKYVDLFDSNGISQLQYVQNGDKLYLFHKKYPLKILERHGNIDWRIKDFEFRNGPWDHPGTKGVVIRSSETSGQVQLQATSGVFKKSDEGRLIRLTVINTVRLPWQADMDVSAGDVLISDNKYYKALNAGKTGTVKPVHSEGTRSDGGISWQYMHSGYGIAKITQYQQDTLVMAEVIGELPFEIKNAGTDYWEMGLIHSGAEYPMCGTFFRNRFCFMLNDNGVPKVCLSCSDDYDNFADKDEGEVLATNAITVPVTSDKYNEGRWLCSSNVLFIGTSSGEFYIDSASSSEAISSDNVKIQQISSTGSRAIMPVKIGAHIIFATESGTSLRDIVYSFSQDSYDPIDLSLFGKHLLQSGIISMVYQENPDKILWMTVADGRLIGLTFSSEQKVFALHQHYLGGKTEGITVIPNPVMNSDDLWLVANRENNSCIEYIEDFKENTKDNMFFVDGGLSLKREINTEELAGVDINIDTSFLFDVTFDVYFDGEKSLELISGDSSVSFTINRKNTEVTTIKASANGNPIKKRNITFPASMYGAVIKIKQEWGHSTVSYEKTEEYTIGKDADTFSFGASEVGFETTNYVWGAEITISGYDLHKKKIPLYGLEHLEGKEVAIMIDGAERVRQIVENGSIEIYNTDKNITVGLPIESAFIPQILYIQGNNGSGIGDVQRVDHVTLMLLSSLGGKIGSGFGDLQDIYFRKNDDEMNESAPLFTGNKTVMTAFNTTNIQEKGATILIYNDSVFPMNILAIAPHFTTSGNGL